MATRFLDRPTVFVLSTAAFVGFGCNTILGIDEGHLVPGSGGSSGSTSNGGGSSGATHTPDSGTGGTSGSGGAAVGGGGGGAPVDAGSDSGTASGVANKVRCGLTSCDIAEHLVLCCRDTLDGANPHCALSCNQGTQTTFFCDGPEDCSAGQQCCLPTGSSQAKCATSCAPTDFVFCAHHADCGPGNYCTFGPDATCSQVLRHLRSHSREEQRVVRLGAVRCRGWQGVLLQQAALQLEVVLEDLRGHQHGTSVACDGPEDCPAVPKPGTDGGTVVTPGQCCATQNPLTGVYTGTRCNVANCVPVGCAATSDCTAGDVCCIRKELQDGLRTRRRAPRGTPVARQPIARASPCKVPTSIRQRALAPAAAPARSDHTTRYPETAVRDVGLGPRGPCPPRLACATAPPAAFGGLAPLAGRETAGPRVWVSSAAAIYRNCPE